MMNFGRISTAMATPFDKDGEIDFRSLTSLVNHLISNGSESLVVAGTTGESPTLSREEKLMLFEHVVYVANGRVPVIAGTGCNNTRASMELTKLAEKTGVDAVMLVTPYYNKPSQEGMYQHFKAVAEATTLPVMLYNIPGRSAAGMIPETIIRLAEIENIMSVKEATGNLDWASQIISSTPDSFLVYSGDDSLTLPMLSVGGTGVVSVSSHIIGNEMQDMVQSFLNGNTAYASKLHRELLPVMKSMFSAPNPVPVKAALEMQGIISGDVRLPMVRLTEEEAALVFTAIEPKKSLYVG
ncbi:4-hydroxy-tetrahydrodipicolinate synthase [Sinobaca sp. H24]|uniref:4-hydroxy-tetrahydrodipicolinate synthase n=1 Tax=Sinobaca sp. H24 TaxID=2923376 RepID=UPI0020794E31|nr:4-hydroxy-tetrahydrodipicolinate synthase [Sinobaca sp. H24]